MKNAKIQLTLVIRPEPDSAAKESVIFQNSTAVSENAEKWLDYTLSAIKGLVLEHLPTKENTREEPETPDSPPQIEAQEEERPAADARPEKAEARDTEREAVKGILLLRCPTCKKAFVKFSRQWVTSLECSCGEILWLNQDSTARFEFECESCGHRTYGRTNLESAVIEAGSLRCNCGQPCPEMLWRPDIKEYRS